MIQKENKNFRKMFIVAEYAALSDVKKNISNQCSLHFYECLAEYVTLLNLRYVV